MPKILDYAERKQVARIQQKMASSRALVEKITVPALVAQPETTDVPGRPVLSEVYRRAHTMMEEAREAGRPLSLSQALDKLLLENPDHLSQRYRREELDGIRDHGRRAGHNALSIADLNAASNELVALAKAYQEAQGVDFRTASEAVAKAHPELYKRYQTSRS